MVILYGVVVRYSDANDNLFLNDKLRAVRADLAVKKANQGELLAEEVASETSDYFVRVLDRRTGKVLAEDRKTAFAVGVSGASAERPHS
jgi:hypothetical protein